MEDVVSHDWIFQTASEHGMTSLADHLGEVKTAGAPLRQIMQAISRLAVSFAEDLRIVAVALTNDRRFEAASIVWGALLQAQPGQINFMIRLLQCWRGLGPIQHLYVDVCPDGVLTKDLWHEIHQNLTGLIRWSWTNDFEGRLPFLRVLVMHKAADLPMKVTLLRILRSDEADHLAQDWLQSETLNPGALVGLADAFELAGHAKAAERFLNHVLQDMPDPPNFHLALLGGRIVAQTGNDEALARFKSACRQAVASDPSLAENSYVFHLLFFDGTTDESIAQSATVLAKALRERRLQMAFFWRYIEAVAQKNSRASLLHRIALELEDSVLERQVQLLSKIIARTADMVQILNSCVDGTWSDEGTTARLLDHVFDQITEPADVQRALEILGVPSKSTKASLREVAAAWAQSGRFDLAAWVWKALSDIMPQDNWARINATFCLHKAGHLADAQALAEPWIHTCYTESTDVFVAQALARIGMSEQAKTLFEQADTALRGKEMPPAVRREIRRGLTLYGAGDRAEHYVNTPAPSDQKPPAEAVILDPGHVDHSSHHPAYNMFFSDFILEHEGHRPQILIGREALGSSLTEHWVTPTMQFEPYVYNEYALGASEITGLNHSFCQELNTLFKDYVPQTLIMHSMRVVMLSGMVEWLAQLGPRAPKKLVIGLIEADHLANEALSQAFTQALSGPLKRLAELHVEHLILFAETAFAVDWLRSHTTGITVHKFPYLAAGRVAGAALSPDIAKLQEPVFGILGATRAERGFNTIFKAILQAGSAARSWLIQVDPDTLTRFGDDSAASLAEIESGGFERVELLKGFLSDEAYFEAFARQNCLVLPYSGRYAVSGSGVLYEAVYSRKYVIISSGSTLALELAELGYPHRTIDPENPEDLVQAVAETHRNWPAIVDAIDQYFAGGPALPVEVFTKLFTQP